jgi:quinol monooxygenase YgiN
MPSLIIRTVLAVNEGAMESFLEVTRRWVALARDEPGTVGYHAFVDQPAGSAIFLEHYADDDAFLVHRDAIPAELRAELYSTCKLDSFEVYGDPSGDAAAALSGARTYGHFLSK